MAVADEAEGRAEAARRIAECRATRSEVLDLGGLMLSEVPEEVYAPGRALNWVTCLYLGVDAEARETPQLVFPVREKDPERCNALRQLSGDLFDELSLVTHLDLSHNELEVLPSSLCRLSALTNLNLRRNRLTSLPEAFTGLTALTSLSLSRNELTALPEALGDLATLSSLNVGGNRFAAVPEAVTRLAALTSLNLRDNGLTVLPEAIGCLTALTSLNLGGNALTALPESIGNLAMLTNLNLGGNGLTALPEPFGRLTALTSLDLGYNLLTEMPEVVTSLTTLTSLNLSANALTALPETIGRLSALTSLDLTSNHLTALPEAIGRLTALSNLDLSGNDLNDLSPLVPLSHLEILNVSGTMTTRNFRELWEKPSLQQVMFEPGRLPGVPPELLSRNFTDNCLPRLRAYYAGLGAGRVQLSDVKVMLLGNGRIGKTKIARRLAGEGYGQDDEPSTHGVQVKAAALSMPAPNPDARLRIWDFGGQDIYHGTHALFLKSRAIFTVVWTPAAERAKTHVDPHGFTHRNQPLGYWLAYVRQLGGERSPVVVIQSQADCREDEEDVKDWVDEAALATFTPRPDTLAYSAKTDRRRGTLNDALVDSVAALRHRDGEIFIPASWHWVQQRLEDMFRLDQQKPPAAREHRLVSLGAYRKLCQTAREQVGPVDDDVLLGYLHDTGTVFYRKGLFDDHLILDQKWALDAVYAVFDRAQGAYADIRDNNGHLRSSLLARRVWAGHGPGEQALFLSFMQQCGICFEWRAADMQHGVEAEFIAPDLLPETKSPEARAVINKWGTRADAEDKRRYPFLPHGLMRTLMSKVGERAGNNADYWRDGFTFYDGKTKSNTKVWQVFDRREDGQEGWSGEIRVATRDGDAEALLAQVLKVVDEESARFGARAEADDSLDDEPAVARRLDRPTVVDAEPATPDGLSRIAFGLEPRKESKRYVSYARADDRSPDGPEREAVVDLLCETAQASDIAIKRDRSDLKTGESITRFMRDIGRGDLIFVVLSDKYWRSAYCMFELWEIWRNCRLDADEVRERTRVFAHPSAGLSDRDGIDTLLAYWRAEEKRLGDKMAADFDGVSDDEIEQRRMIRYFLPHLVQIRAAFKDTVREKSEQAYVAWALEGLTS